MKIKFSVDITTTKEIVLGEVIDNDAQRLCLTNLSQQKDNQFYHDLKKGTLEGLQMIKLNIGWVAEKERESSEISHFMVTVLMISTSYLGHYEKKINNIFEKF